MPPSRLELRTIHRTGGAHQQERFTYDFIVDGKSLAIALGERALVGCLDAMNRDVNEHAGNALLLAKPADVPPDRVMIYVCPECADLGCGAITARITRTAEEFLWSDFRYENNYDPDATQPHDTLGPYRFPAADYISLIRAVMPLQKRRNVP